MKTVHSNMAVKQPCASSLCENKITSSSCDESQVVLEFHLNETMTPCESISRHDLSTAVDQRAKYENLSTSSTLKETQTSADVNVKIEEYF